MSGAFDTAVKDALAFELKTTERRLTMLEVAVDVMKVESERMREAFTDYGIWWGWQNQSQWVHLTDFPMGTPVTTTIRWDQPSHRFIALLKVKNGLYLMGTSSYAVPDSTPPASPSKSLSAATFAPNCTVLMTTSEVEANFDNVIINQ